MKKLEAFTFGNSSGGSKHPWKLWLNGDINELTPEDFGGKIPLHIGSQARLVAQKMGLSVRVKKTERGTVVMQAFKPSNNGPQNADVQQPEQAQQQRPQQQEQQQPEQQEPEEQKQQGKRKKS